MQLLRLLARVAFICNICFLLASLILWLPNPPEGTVISTVIIMGCLLGLLVNTIVNGWLAILLATGKWRTVAIPVWLFAVNLVVFILQLLSLIFNRK